MSSRKEIWINWLVTMFQTYSVKERNVDPWGRVGLVRCGATDFSVQNNETTVGRKT